MSTENPVDESAPGNALPRRAPVTEPSGEAPAPGDAGRGEERPPAEAEYEAHAGYGDEEPYDEGEYDDYDEEPYDPEYDEDYGDAGEIEDLDALDAAEERSARRPVPLLLSTVISAAVLVLTVALTFLTGIRLGDLIVPGAAAGIVAVLLGVVGRGPVQVMAGMVAAFFPLLWFVLLVRLLGFN